MRRRAIHIKAGSNQFRQERIRETAWRQAADKLSSILALPLPTMAWASGFPQICLLFYKRRILNTNS